MDPVWTLGPMCPMNSLKLWNLLKCMILCCWASIAHSSYILENFSDSLNTGNFNNLVIHQSTGKIYIGAVNKLYLLSETLGLEKTENTGPRYDVVNCLPPFENCPCIGTDCDNEKLTDSINKALLIDYDSGSLIMCSNLFQGHCEQRSLTDLGAKEPQKWVPVVPNDATSPVVMFIGPGPGEETPTKPRPKALYIAATRSLAESIYKDMVPTICSRNLTTYDLVYDDTFTATRVEIDTQQRQTFRIRYIYGFSSGGFSYFLTVQGKSVTETDNYVSRIVRVCQNDTRFYSYAEVPFSCMHNNTKYKIVQAAYLGYAGKELATSLRLPDLENLRTSEAVLYAIFSNQNPDELPTSVGGSVVCVYPLRDIRWVFTTNIQECFKGMGNTGPAHISRPLPCTHYDDVENVLNDDYCGRYEFNHPISGSMPVEANAVMYFPNESATAIAVTETHDYTVAFVGMKSGSVHKIAVESSESAFEYESVVVQEGSPVNPDLAFDRSREHLYVMTEKKVTRLRTEECSRYTNCSQCLGAEDPFCGWCSLDNRCSLRKDCDNADDPMRWLPYTGSQCTKIVQVQPENVQIQERNSTRLTVIVQNLPTLTNGQYECAFRMGNESPRFTRASLIGNPTQESTNRTLQCDTPMPNRLPPIPTGKDHMVMTLSIRMDDRDFVEKDITFFNCVVHTSCTSCTSSEFPCSWCVHAHSCTYYREQCTTDRMIITGKNLPGNTDTPGPEFCPRIENHVTEILVASDTTYNVQIIAMHLQSFQDNFYCKFNLAEPKVVGARKQRNLDNIDLIQCDEVQFRYAGSSHSRAVPFQILWGTSKQPLDNPDTIQVMMYKCTAMATNCGECLTTDSKFGCGWCSDSGQCTTSTECAADWLDQNADCPNPSITRFTPFQGPTQGGTLLTIHGENLGKRFSDIEYGVLVANIICDTIASEYRAATTIVCRTGPSTSVTYGPIEIDINGLQTGPSSGIFRYVEPYLMGLTPGRGPQAGGTRVTITGEYMDAGTDISVTIGNNRCTDQRTYPSEITCTVPPMQPETDEVTRVVVRFDHAEMVAETFHYIQDPHIAEVNPQKGIYSGGTQLEVTGERLDVIQKPQIIVYYKGETFTSDCSDVTSTSMKCTSPSFTASSFLSPNISSEEPIMMSYGFIMDQVSSLQNLTALDETKLFQVFGNPEFLKFDDGVRSMFQLKKHDDLLTINGVNMNHALSEEDVRVMVGTAECEVTSLSATVLTCTPPDFQKLKIGDKPEVYVYVGQNLSFHIGQLQIETPDPSFTLPIFIAIGVAAGVFILIIIIVVFVLRRRTKESDRQIKRMQNQMDVLEARVAKECKEAFAELQTDMTELTGDICGLAGIPFRDYRSFCMRVLFPNVPEDEHPVTKATPPQEFYPLHGHNVDKGLFQFNQLIQHKLFLLIFIRTLEQDKSFTAKDKVNVASLISCALQNRMEYHTEILKTLLAELIEKSMDSNEHPRLLLRRTNSVAEKMLTNWFTFLLYKFLKECVGEPLYMLFRAMKQQVDKGPVDALTSEARYSLSEDKLIRDRVDYKQLMIYVADTAYPTRDHQVRVLDCDTISQVKEKALDGIYKNSPFSSRPDKEDLELEWRTGETGRLILQDEDATTKNESEYRKLNTLGHYHVRDNSRMALVRKQTSMYNLSLASDRSHAHLNNYSVNFSGSPSLSRSVSPHTMIHHMENGGTKYCHLVKHDTDNQKGDDRGNKMVSEIYLTRLLATKGTLQQFVDDLLETIFSTATRRCALPLAIKYMFDFLDDQALQHCITNPEVVHTWKSNSLPLRFWINVVKNPDFVFDTHKSNIVDACLSVVAQTFMDSCSMSELRLSKDSPSSKLLYAKDIPKYKKWVERYYQDIKQMPAISDQDMNAMLAEESRLHQDEFNLNAALYELYQYVAKYKDDLITNLQEDEFARNYHLVDRLIRVTEMIESEV